jgi:hypothetical protein
MSEECEIKLSCSTHEHILVFQPYSSVNITVKHKHYICTFSTVVIILHFHIIVKRVDTDFSPPVCVVAISLSVHFPLPSVVTVYIQVVPCRQNKEPGGPPLFPLYIPSRFLHYCTVVDVSVLGLTCVSISCSS